MAVIVASVIVCMLARQLIPEYSPFAGVTRRHVIPLRKVDARPVEAPKRLAKILAAHAARLLNRVHEKADQTINAISRHCELSCSVVSFSDNLTYRPIRSACQIFFDMVLAKIVMDCHWRDISRRIENARLWEAIG